jgi:NAD/NADP transhydrogenase beta subunit
MNDTTAGRSPAQLYALVFGTTLVLAGILGFFYSASFGSPGKVDGVLGILDVNGWHNIVHIASGIVGLLMLSYSAARTYAVGFGAVYVVVAIWGFAVGDGGQILSIIPVNTEDNVLHALIGLAGLGAYAATPAAAKPTTVRRGDAPGAAA